MEKSTEWRSRATKNEIQTHSEKEGRKEETEKEKQLKKRSNWKREVTRKRVGGLVWEGQPLNQIKQERKEPSIPFWPIEEATEPKIVNLQR